MRRMRAGGFTLVELMVTIAIVAILAAIAFPNFESTMRSNRVTTSTNELIASINLARSEALRSPGGAVICASSNGSSCTGTWSQGWIVWMDLDGKGTMDGNDRVVRYSQARNKIDISASGGVTSIVFDHRGRALQAPSLTVASSPCPAASQLKRVVSLTAAGQVTTTRVACNA